MKLKVPSSLVNVDWLYNNLNNENIIVLDATIQKVGARSSNDTIKEQIPQAVFFDLKNVFCDREGVFPNTVPIKEHFQKEVRKLGVNNDSCVVVYDTLGVYSSPRVWWLFKLFGFENVAVLNGGLNEWKRLSYKVELAQESKIQEGNFTASYNKEVFATSIEVLKSLDEDVCILDARSIGRFEATTPEPREGLRGGHIPNSKSLPYAVLQEEGKMKTLEELKKLYANRNPKNQEMIFTCGSGITACILALGADVSGYKKYKVYDGSWTEWASKLELPIEK
ncbi:Sulfurtransferase [Tenacibaculum sp. 190130A14a]|uniref:Thiosulfate/3-mercaptopyruvate sulfurtransferase n=1 Tax=Tenacibaculum polynesiense TaxID=3137857 RepID=A0ABP1F1M6_9FLAO